MIYFILKPYLHKINIQKIRIASIFEELFLFQWLQRIISFSILLIEKEWIYFGCC